jgi:hypothetical protein
MKLSHKICAVLVLLGSVQAQGVDTVKTYLVKRVQEQQLATARLVSAADRYGSMARSVGFDYNKLAKQSAVRSVLSEARAAWVKASPIYESIEGIVAGVESLADFDLNLDAGASASEGGDAVVTFDLRLANGKVLAKPGNAFGVSEGSLWGSEQAFSSRVPFDVDADGRMGFGDYLPEAYILQAAAKKLDSLTAELLAAAKQWQPTPEDVFKALVANVPTVGPVFIDRWKTSRFVLGEKAKRRDFNVVSSLDDLVGNITSWQQLYGGVSGRVQQKNTALDKQIGQGLAELKTWTQRLVTQEKTRRFTPEQAEAILQEGNNLATALTGKMAQAAALVGVKVQ